MNNNDLFNDTSDLFWYCPDPKCKHYKIRMSINDNLKHLIDVHKMKAPKDYKG